MERTETKLSPAKTSTKMSPDKAQRRGDQEIRRIRLVLGDAKDTRVLYSTLMQHRTWPVRQMAMLSTKVSPTSSAIVFELPPLSKDVGQNEEVPESGACVKTSNVLLPSTLFLKGNCDVAR